MGRRRFPGGWTVILTLLFLAPANARILKTRTSVSTSGAFWNSVVVGSGLELQSDSIQTEYQFPLLLECNLTRDLKLSLEPDFVYISAHSRDARTIGGLGDLETALEYEFVHERRYRPALAATSIVRWPTASDPDLGNPGRDYSLGLIVSKDLVYCDLDLNLLYTFVGDPDEDDNLEAGLAVEWHVTHRFDVIAEVVSTLGSGGVRGDLGTLGGSNLLNRSRGANNQIETTLGAAYHANKHLKFEHGVTYVSNGSWQFQFAWEWSFGGE